MMIVQIFCLRNFSWSRLLLLLLLDCCYNRRSTAAFARSSSSSSTRCHAFIGFSNNKGTSSRTSFLYSSSSSSSSSAAARDLLYQDQQNAKARRAAEEEVLLAKSNPQELLEAAAASNGSGKKKKKNKSSSSGGGGGGGFGAGSSTAKNNKGIEFSREVLEQAKLMDRDGVIRINQVLTPAVADELLAHVLEQQRLAEIQTERDLELSRELYGVENQRKKRCDLLLSLVRNNNNDNEDDEESNGSSSSSSSSFVIADALQELLGEKGTLRQIYEKLVTKQGEFYEFAAVITDPGSDRQQIHPDLPFRKVAPLYVIFIALQDVTPHMGPTTFLLGSHTEQETRRFNDASQRDEQLATSTSRLALLNKGDAVLFDARVLHCGNANHAQHGRTRAMFNFSFRNPVEVGNLGYDGSMRPGYCSTMNLGDVEDALVDYKKGNKDPFAKYGNGLISTPAVGAGTTK